MTTPTPAVRRVLLDDDGRPRSVDEVLRLLSSEFGSPILFCVAQEPDEFPTCSRQAWRDGSLAGRQRAFEIVEEVVAALRAAAGEE